MLKVLNILLTILIFVAGYFLVRTIQEPIEFNIAKVNRHDLVKEKLTYIRDLELAYKDVHDRFSGSFDSLAIFLQQDSMKITKVVGDPDELDVYGKPVKVTYSIIKIAVRDTLTNTKFAANELATIPGVEGEKFNLAASKMEKGRVIVPVFEVIATDIQMLKGLRNKYIDPLFELRMGSMLEPNYNGNW